MEQPLTMLRLHVRDRLLSWIRPRVLVRTQSVVNSRLEVVEDSGRRLLNSATANYSYGGLFDVFKLAFQHFCLNEQQFNRVLILGFGAGSIVELIKLHPLARVVGVEIDPEVIHLYENYFTKFESVQVVCAEAQDYLQQDSEFYDLILVDVFVDRQTPNHLLKPEFLKLLLQHLTPRGILLFNRIEEDETESIRNAFREAFAATWGQMRTFRTDMNTFYCNR